MDEPLKAAFPSLRRSRRVSYMMSGWFQTVTLSSEGGGTAAATIACPDDFFAVRLGFPNITDKPWSIKKVIGSASSTYNDFVNPTGDAAWVPFTFASKGRDTDRIVAEPDAPTEIIVAAGVERPTWTWTDWAPISSITPPDSRSMRVLMLRALLPPGSTVCFANGQMRSLLENDHANSGFEYFVGGLKFGIDRVTHTSSREPTNAWLQNHLVGGSIFPMVQFLTKNPGITGITTGDSHQQGTSTTEQFTNFLYRSVTKQIRKSAGKVPFGMVNCAVGGLTSPDFFDRMTSLLEPVRPSYAILPGWTYNDRTGGIHADRIAMDKFFSRLLAAVEQCTASGILPVLTTPFPRDKYAMGEAQFDPWLWLRQMILGLEGPGLVVLDTSHVLGNRTNGQLDGTYLPNFSSDQSHPNDAGHEAVANLLLPFLGKIG